MMLCCQIVTYFLKKIISKTAYLIFLKVIRELMQQRAGNLAIVAKDCIRLPCVQ